MRRECKLSKKELQRYIDDVKTQELYLKEHKKAVYGLLPWLTDCTQEELKYIEHYFILKYQVLPILKDLIKDPVMIEYTNITDYLAK